MALHINNPQADALVREVANLTGTTNTEAIINAMEAQLDALKQQAKNTATAKAAKRAKIAAIIAEFQAQPEINTHLTEDEILGYPDMFPEMYPEYHEEQS